MICVNSICFNPEKKTLIVGNSLFLHPTICPENATNKCVTWSSDDMCVATVNPNSGLVYAQNAGTTVIRAIAQDGSGVVGVCNLTVTDPICVENINLSRTYLTLYKGNTHRLCACVCPIDATNQAICWSSSKTSIVTVNATTGLVRAKAAGRAYIYATAQDGSGTKARCEIIVKQTVVSSVEETPKNKVQGSTFADPVDVYTGAHQLGNTIMSLFGGQETQV